MTDHDVPLAGPPGGGLPGLLRRRRSTKRFAAHPITLAEVAALAWAAQGDTGDGRRVCPSAHALYPLSVTVVAGAVTALDSGTYRYHPDGHHLRRVAVGDRRAEVADTTLVDADWLRGAAAVLVLGADLAAADRHFADQPPDGHRGQRYVWVEAGCAVQNVYLQAAEHGLGAVLVGGFHDDALRALAILPDGHHPLALLGIGRPGIASPARG